MTKTQKQALVEDLTQDFSASNAIAVCDYKGLTVGKLEALRKSLRQKGAKVRVVKNTLAKIALENSQKDGLDLEGTNIFIWGEDQLEIAKAIADFAKLNSDFFSIKKGHFEGEIVDGAHIDALSKMPSKDELIGMLLSVWTAPMRYMVTGLDRLHTQKSQN